MTLADKIRAQRADKIARQMRDDALHGRSHYPDREADGADAFRHGYPLEACPYANTQAVDADGRPVTVTDDAIRMAAAWRRGWLAADLPASPAAAEDQGYEWSSSFGYPADQAYSTCWSRGEKRVWFKLVDFGRAYVSAADPWDLERAAKMAEAGR